jgi:hypothetical protein
MGESIPPEPKSQADAPTPAAAPQGLLQEVSALRERLGSAEERERALLEQAARLEAELRWVTTQQDEFLAGLLEEHEAVQALAIRYERERNELRAEALQLRARLGGHFVGTIPPGPTLSARPALGEAEPSAAPPSATSRPVRSIWPHAPATEPPISPISAASLPADSVGSLPILKRKPDPATRPLVDYSLGEGGVQSETLEGASIATKSSKPPKR